MNIFTRFLALKCEAILSMKVQVYILGRGIKSFHFTQTLINSVMHNALIQLTSK